MKKETILTIAGRKPEENHGIVNPPVYHASTVTFPTVAALREGVRNKLNSVFYGRTGTPTTFAFEEAVAALEGGGRTVAMPSGLAAVACTLMSFLKAGDHVLVTDSVYGPTRSLCNGLLTNFGVSTSYYDPLIGAGIADLMRPETKVVLMESPGSWTFEVQDVPAICAAAHAGGAVAILDNTWSAGLFFSPFEHGVDVSVQAATKYMSGHSDAMLGTVTATDEHYARVKKTAADLGYCAGPDDLYLGLRGIRSLTARMARHQETALILARWLQKRPEVEAVLHPAFPGCPGHDIWKRDFSGSSGLFSFVLKDVGENALAAMLNGLELYAMGFSWGGYESLILPIDPGSVRTVSRWPYSGPTLRIHTGQEHPDDLIADLEMGFARLNAAT